MSADSETTRDRMKQLMKLHLTSVMSFFIGLGALTLGIGVYLNIPLMTSLGASLFSASTVSVIFKVIGYDIYLKDTLEHTLKEHDAIIKQNLDSILERRNVQVQETIKQALTKFEFVKMLSESECRDLFKSTILAWKKGEPSPDVYDAFEKIAEEMVGLVDENRHYSIVLERAPSYGENILRSTVTFKCKRCNESGVERQLFPDGLVAEMKVTAPRTLDISKIRITPEELGRGYDLRINDEPVLPDEDENKWINNKNLNEGSAQVIRSSHKIPAKTSMTVSHESEFLLDDSDYIIRRFTLFTNGVDLEIHHPAGFEIETVWFRSKRVKVHDPKKETRVYRQSAEGVFFPGEGFIIIAKRRK